MDSLAEYLYRLRKLREKVWDVREKCHYALEASCSSLRSLLFHVSFFPSAISLAPAVRRNAVQGQGFTAVTPPINRQWYCTR